jgi:hypothetical protein
MIRSHAKYRRRERLGSRSEKNNITFDHFVRSQAARGAQDSQNVDRNRIVSVDTLHVVVIVSDHMQSIGAANGREAVWKKRKWDWPCWALTRPVSAQNGQY